MKVFGDVLDRELVFKNIDSTKSQNLHFSKGFHGFA